MGDFGFGGGRRNREICREFMLFAELGSERIEKNP
jgi:hypothetical protein